VSARIIDGKAVASKVHDEVAAGVAEFKSKYGTVPGLTVVLIGDVTLQHLKQS
jgi:methylenetetrahydrofolate dehydrogenase (NADP+)/methenyltetrahydrofolate cyclohydrolase